ncbi:MAG: hypothetical protein AAFR77_23075, partial [Cyanobacteria bacterium J06631_2]
VNKDKIEAFRTRRGEISDRFNCLESEDLVCIQQQCQAKLTQDTKNLFTEAGVSCANCNKYWCSKTGCQRSG